MAGYSGTPLVKKLGIKEGFRIAFVGAPPNFDQELDVLPEDVKKIANPKNNIDFVLLFTKSAGELRKNFSRYARTLAPNGMLWICWPKKSSGVATDLNENVVREIGLAAGMVDVKVCAVTEIWSGLKFVYRLEDRKGIGG
jgi:hypothetical protein